MIRSCLFRRILVQWTIPLLLSLLLLVTILPSVMVLPTFKISRIESGIQHEIDSQIDEMSDPLKPRKLTGGDLTDRISYSRGQLDQETYFPDFLYYSKTIANALIDYMYDNVTGGFYRSAGEDWLENSINKDKHVHDQARVIIALLKLAQGVINETERDYAIEIANQTANYMISDLWDPEFGGFTLLSSGTTQKPPGMQGVAIQALLELYNVTGNQILLDKAIETIDFVNNFGWDSTNGGYYYLLSHSGILASTNVDSSDPYSPDSKKVDHNVIMAQAMLKLYSVSSDPLHLSRAVEIFQFINTTCRNTTTGLFYTGVGADNQIIEPRESDVFINSLVLEFLSQLYDATGDLDYYDDFFDLLRQLLINFWDNRYGGFFTTYSYDGEANRDTNKYIERQFYAIRALDEAYRLTNQSSYSWYNIILDTIEVAFDTLYDQFHEGFYHVVTKEGVIIDPNWKRKLTVPNSLAVYELANLWLYSLPGVINTLWLPNQPRPEDSVEIVLAAFDNDGISSVQLNYSLNSDPYQILEMEIHPTIGNLYRIELDQQPDGTTIDFNINVLDNLSNKAIRGSYNFLWREDIWAPHVGEVGIEPGFEINVYTGVKMTVSAQDVPSQGRIAGVSIHYHEAGQQEKIKTLQSISSSETLWQVEFPDGFDRPVTISYHYVAIDGNGNLGKSQYYALLVYGKRVTLPLFLIVAALFTIMLIVPSCLYVYVEYKKKHARKKIKVLKKRQRMPGSRLRGTRRR